MRTTYAPALHSRLSGLRSDRLGRRRLGALTFALTQLVLLFWWTSYYPGLMSYDSVMYVWQATTSHWSTSHSVVYNAALWLSLQTTGEVALLTLAQTVLMAGGLTYAVTGLRRLGVPGKWLATAAVAAVCLPVIGTFTIYVSKDTAFVLCQVYLLGTVVRLLGRQPGPADRPDPRPADRPDPRPADRPDPRPADCPDSLLTDSVEYGVRANTRAGRDGAGRTGEGHKWAGRDGAGRTGGGHKWAGRDGAGWWHRLVGSGRHGGGRGLWWGLFVELALISLLRPNGFLVTIVAIAVMAIVLSGLRWRLAGVGAAAIATGLLFTSVVFPAIGVQRAGSELVLGPAYADLAVAYHDRPAVFDAHDLALLSTVAPLGYWRDTANCYSADSTVAFNRPLFSIDAARAHQAQLFDLWLKVVKRAPDVVTQARICRGSIAWNPFPGPAQGWTVKIPIAGFSNYFDFPAAQIAQSPYRSAIHLAPLSRTANKLATFARRLSDTRSFEWFAWRGATWSYVAYLAVGLLAWRRRRAALLALVAIVVANQLTVAVNNPSQLVRYMAGPLVLGILLLPLAFVRRPVAHGPQAGGSDGLAVDGRTTSDIQNRGIPPN